MPRVSVLVQTNLSAASTPEGDGRRHRAVKKLLRGGATSGTALECKQLGRAKAWLAHPVPTLLVTRKILMEYVERPAEWKHTVREIEREDQRRKHAQLDSDGAICPCWVVPDAALIHACRRPPAWPLLGSGRPLCVRHGQQASTRVPLTRGVIVRLFWLHPLGNLGEYLVNIATVGGRSEIRESYLLIF